jgi:hypothetical protein
VNMARMVVALMWLGALAVSEAAARDLAWHEHYLKGVTLVEEGRGQEARVELEKALLARPASGLQVPTHGVRYIDYVPHVYLAAACQMTGDLAEARKHLALAERGGIEVKSAAAQSLLLTYRPLLATGVSKAAAGEAPAEPARAMTREETGYRMFTRKPPTLPEADYAQLKREVLSRCHLGGDTDARRAPWYFHYELGRELIDRGDPQRALDSFIEAATRKAQPQKNARIYGMWQTDYMPYFQIARAHARLENWDCAKSALTVSQREAEISPEDKEFAEMRALVAETQRKLER